MRSGEVTNEDGRRLRWSKCNALSASRPYRRVSSVLGKFNTIIAGQPRINPDSAILDRRCLVINLGYHSSPPLSSLHSPLRCPVASLALYLYLCSCLSNNQLSLYLPCSALLLRLPPAMFFTPELLSRRDSGFGLLWWVTPFHLNIL